MITAFASVDTAVQALKQGAFDYVTKPIDPDELSHLVRKALMQRRLQAENQQLKTQIHQRCRTDEIIGESPAMMQVLDLVSNVAVTDATVMIRGESGTGKELIAQAIHANSKRKYFPIVAVNCGALSESLLESELFGHEKGAFTGANYQRKGKIELAHGGTLFLDEIGTISTKTQVELLRVLESKEFVRLGGHKTLHVDFRVIAATNQGLEEQVERGEFREDLFYRLNVFTIELPPLRKRRSDIPLLANHFLERYALQMNKPIRQIEPAAMDILVRSDWPGNVRELANAIERAMVIGHPPAIRATDLPFRLAQDEAPSRTREDDSLASMEKAHIALILDQLNWNITHAAQRLGIDRATLYNKIKKYKLREEAGR